MNPRPLSLDTIRRGRRRRGIPGGAGLLRRCLGTVMTWASLLALMGAAPEPAPVRFNTNFEGGSLGTIERLGEATFRCHVRGQQDEHGRNRQASWYYFRLDGVRGRDLTITMTD